MVSSIVQIGNSRGIILPSWILQKFSLSLKSPVSISIEGENIVLNTQIRNGWEEAAMKAHENGDDKLLVPDLFEDEKIDGEWVW